MCMGESLPSVWAQGDKVSSAVTSGQSWCLGPTLGDLWGLRTPSAPLQAGPKVGGGLRPQNTQAVGNGGGGQWGQLEV